MSPFDGAAGFSDWTPEKYSLVADVLTVWEPLARAVARKHGDVRFGLVDATSGPGRVNGYDGTPLMLARLADNVGADLFAFERDAATHERLTSELGTAAICADSLEALRLTADLFPRFGFLIYDPNPRDGALPIDALNRWACVGRRDLLAFVSANAVYKRHPDRQAEQIADDLRQLDWTFVCITEPRFDQQWIAIFATRWEKLARAVCRGAGFEPIDDATGADWLRVASTVGAERAPRGQLSLSVESRFPSE